MAHWRLNLFSETGGFNKACLPVALVFSVFMLFGCAKEHQESSSLDTGVASVATSNAEPPPPQIRDLPVPPPLPKGAVKPAGETGVKP
jgi:hypothetical protein